MGLYQILNYNIYLFNNILNMIFIYNIFYIKDLPMVVSNIILS